MASTPRHRAAKPLRAGDQVPWTVAWTAEAGFTLRRSAVFPGYVELVQEEKPGHGHPTFASLHVSRHRRAMREMLCHVCGVPTAAGDRYIFPSASGREVKMTDGAMGYGSNIPPLHLGCAERSRRQCPQLRAGGARFMAFPNEEGRLIPRTDMVPGMEALAGRLPAGVAVVLSCYRLYSAGFADAVALFLSGA